MANRNMPIAAARTQLITIGSSIAAGCDPWSPDGAALERSIRAFNLRLTRSKIPPEVRHRGQPRRCSVDTGAGAPPMGNEFSKKCYLFCAWRSGHSLPGPAPWQLKGGEIRCAIQFGTSLVLSRSPVYRADCGGDPQATPARSRCQGRYQRASSLT